MSWRSITIFVCCCEVAAAVALILSGRFGNVTAGVILLGMVLMQVVELT